MTISQRSQSYKPDHFNFTRDVVDYWNKEGGDPIAMLWKAPDETNPGMCHELRFSHFSQRARDVAQGLRRLGIRKGDVLLLLSSKTPDWYEIACGAMLAGVVICPNPSSLLPPEIELRARKAGASVLVGESKQICDFLSERERQKTSETCVRQIIQIGHHTQSANCNPAITLYHELMRPGDPAGETDDFETDPQDVCLMYFTSGTTGESKIVQHSHLSYPYAHIVTGEHWLDIVPGKVLWNMSEQGWAKAAWALFGAWSQGAALFVDSDPGPFDPERVRDNLSRYPINVFCAAPTVYRQLLTGDSRGLFQDRMPQTLERCVSAGEALAPQVIMEWHDMTDGLIIHDGFGQTETSILCGHYKSTQVRPGSMGKALPGIPLHVLDEKRQIARPFEEGDLAIRVPAEADLSCFLGLFSGYLHESSSAVRPVCEDFQGHAWYLIGDRAYCDEEGYFWYKGRGDDIIISAGHRISPVDVESVLQTHPAVLESAVIAAPDADRGSIIKAFIVLQKDSTMLETQLKQAIREHFLQRSAAHNCPQQLEFVQYGFLPKTLSGKIIRKQLRMLELHRT